MTLHQLMEMALVPFASLTVDDMTTLEKGKGMDDMTKKGMEMDDMMVLVLEMDERHCLEQEWLLMRRN